MELNGIKIKQVRNGVKDFKSSRREQVEWIFIGCLGIVFLNVLEIDGCMKLVKYYQKKIDNKILQKIWKNFF